MRGVHTSLLYYDMTLKEQIISCSQTPDPATPFPMAEYGERQCMQNIRGKMQSIHLTLYILQAEDYKVSSCPIGLG